MTDRPLPPGQNVLRDWPVEHYGRIPPFRNGQWSLLITGRTASGGQASFSLEELAAMPHTEIEADLHCGRGWTVQSLHWGGIPVEHLITLHPPAPEVTHVLAWAEFGYSSTVRLQDLRRPTTIIADTLDGQPLPRERGHPLRLVVPHLYGYKGPKWLRGLEYLTEPTRGFWEDRGWHIDGDPWNEERYSYQE